MRTIIGGASGPKANWTGRRWSDRVCEACTACYGVILPSAVTSNASPGSIPFPGVPTTRVMSVPLADTPSAGSGRVRRTGIRITDSDPLLRPNGNIREGDLPAVWSHPSEGEHLKLTPTRMQVRDVHVLYTLGKHHDHGRVCRGRRHIAEHDGGDVRRGAESGRLISARRDPKQYANDDERESTQADNLVFGAVEYHSNIGSEQCG